MFILIFTLFAFYSFSAHAHKPDKSELNELCPGYFSDPGGIEGRDWARTDFIAKPGVIVRVSATNVTINPKGGNTSTIVIKVNGEIKLEKTASNARVSDVYDISGKGPYKVEVICKNHLADAGKCSIQHYNQNMK